MARVPLEHDQIPKPTKTLIESVSKYHLNEDIVPNHEQLQKKDEDVKNLTLVRKNTDAVAAKEDSKEEEEVVKSANRNVVVVVVVEKQHVVVVIDVKEAEVANVEDQRV